MQPWVRAAVLLGLLYALVGIAFAAPDTHVRFWRFAAWAVCGVAYIGHVAYEHFRLGQTPRSAAVHLALAAALGALGLAIGANVNSLSTVSSAQVQRLLLIALVIWPLIVAIPAFLVSLGITTLLARSPWRAPRQTQTHGADVTAMDAIGAKVRPGEARIDALTAEVILAIRDDDLEFSLADYVARRIAADGDEQRAIERLPPKLLTWYVAFIVDAEVLNGGFNQLFFNPSGRYAAIAPAAYQEIGAPEAGALVVQALALLEEHLPALEAAAKEGTVAAFAQTYTEQPFEELDSAWAAQEALYRAARLRYLRDRATTLGLP